jgi:DNA-binding MarR family transcriptional regulator
MIETPQTQEMLAELAESTAAALLAFAQAVRPASDREDDGADLASLGLGRRQREIATLASLDTDEGLSTSEVAREIDYDAANTHAALYALAARGVAESFRHDEHTRWRLTARYRSANPYLPIAQLVTAGEWTTFDDISLVVHGDLRHGREVMRASVELPDCPAHRVLPPGGQVPRAWRSYETKTADPGECVRLLAGEGVAVDGDGRASRVHYIGWDLLAERAADAGRLG